MDDYVFELNQCTNKEQPVLIVVQRQCIVTPIGLFLMKSFGVLQEGAVSNLEEIRPISGFLS